MTEKKRYYIEISYQTGDSFNTYDDVSSVGMEWDDLEVAKENLRRIREHHKWYEKYNRNYSHDEKEKEKNRPKFVPKDHEWSVRLKADNGNEAMISAFWSGYFETLYSAEIKERDNPDLVYVTEQGKWKT